MRAFTQAGVVLSVALGATLGVSMGQDGPTSKPVKPSRASVAKDVAKRWTEHMAHGKLEKVMALSAVPFAYDRQTLIESKKDLEVHAEATIRTYATPKFKIQTVDVKDDVSMIRDDCVPHDRVLVTVRIFNGRRGGNASVIVCVQPGDDYKVVGFTWE